MQLANSHSEPMHWFGIDLFWAYTALLPSINKKTHCLHHAKDILHDGFLRFALSKSPNRAHAPHAYLSVIVQNLVIEKYRKEAYFEDYQASLTHDILATPSPEYLLDMQQRLTLLIQMIEDLPPRCREVFILFRIEGLSQKAIAAQLNISLNMVERHIIRALLDIRTIRLQLLT